MIAPFFTFYGGKFRAAPRYPAPLHDTIVEPFAGSAGYSVRHHARRVILVERDPVIAGTWRYLLRVSPAEVLGLPDIEPGQSTDHLPVCQEARWLIGWWLNKGTSSPRKSMGKWGRENEAGVYGTKRDRCVWSAHIRVRIAAQVETIRHWTLIEGDYTDAPDIEAAWFVDPPYQLAGKHYRFGPDRIDYAHLAAFCRSRRGQVVVCENTGADWLPFRHHLDMKASEARHGGKVSREAIWTASPEPPQPSLFGMAG